MIDVYNKAIDDTIKVDRILNKIQGYQPGPTMVFFGGIHGNETSGVFALKDTLSGVSRAYVNGTIYGIAGNLAALKKHQRFITDDLNRLWTKQNIDILKSKTNLNDDETELIELLDILNTILNTHSGPFYFIDLHTTSSKTLPFITINDALINRQFSKQFPVPIVLGIEEYLNGPLLSYINQLGYVSLGFESGQHDDFLAITNSIAFIHLALVYSGILEKEAIINFNKYHEQLKQQASNTFDVFEVVYLHSIQKDDVFKMHTGFRSFQPVKKGTKLAISNGTEIMAPYNGSIFMPLYQKRGADGFFIIKPINPFFLKLSALLRKVKTDSVLVLLPGISWENKKEGILKVNLRVAKYFAKAFFHLLGYRSKQITASHILFNNRERVAKTSIYKKELWY
ncbi:succinylglutamate desuccinylase/aspartoacylase family protein [Tamlana fucoidanivorans]|uniref:Succinylglutamate desuccinylase/aspartoacylase family protein n=1 Tax=Allotamlana fucoidanivorans TaxID=2583814 RepID=A0A5C4STK1_9FLAO|nr:succinylglutamate desuccinylase/aspartoacylase family protein [Tamlana fucoidanivorans]TNJ47099.1 succinylglutamate desuccinylase/aspartoacylase family protein [Tamlana fucoidanivorans]